MLLRVTRALVLLYFLIKFSCESVQPRTSTRTFSHLIPHKIWANKSSKLVLSALDAAHTPFQAHPSAPWKSSSRINSKHCWEYSSAVEVAWAQQAASAPLMSPIRIPHDAGEERESPYEQQQSKRNFSHKKKEIMCRFLSARSANSIMRRTECSCQSETFRGPADFLFRHLMNRS